MFDNINLEDELVKERERQEAGQDSVLSAVKEIFELDYERELKIMQGIRNAGRGDELLSPEGLDPKRIFSLDEIRNTCIRYRLRFLDSQLFKGSIPYEATLKIKNLGADTENQRLKIMAPSERFELKDSNADPLLFAPLSDGRYYLIHQWGTDLAWYKAVLAYPFRKIDTLVISITVLAALIALLLPTSLIDQNPNAAWLSPYRLLFFLWAVVALGAVASYSLFTFNKNFSSSQWNSKYFN